MITTTTLGALTLSAATLATGMVAGLLYSFAHSAMPGLRELDDRGFLAAFQRIDSAISNPWMKLNFLASPVLTSAALLLHLPERGHAVPWLAVALMLALVTVTITVAIHLPLNAEIHDAAPEFLNAGRLRARFEDRWVPWNAMRTLTSMATCAALAWALFVAGRSAA